jgi:hypothetical protein
MDIAECFNDKSDVMKYERRGECPHILLVNYRYDGFYQTYDFAARQVLTRHDHSIAVTPFAQVDPESLAALRQKLIDLGGKPPELPSAGSSAPAPSSGQLKL